MLDPSDFMNHVWVVGSSHACSISEDEVIGWTLSPQRQVEPVELVRASSEHDIGFLVAIPSSKGERSNE